MADKNEDDKLVFNMNAVCLVVNNIYLRDLISHHDRERTDPPAHSTDANRAFWPASPSVRVVQLLKRGNENLKHRLRDNPGASLPPRIADLAVMAQVRQTQGQYARSERQARLVEAGPDYGRSGMDKRFGKAVAARTPALCITAYVDMHKGGVQICARLCKTDCGFV